MSYLSAFNLVSKKVMRSTLAAVFAACLSSGTMAAVVISDGFGDADINNNGVIEDVDVSVQGGLGSTTYIPGRLYVDGMSAEPTNAEVAAPLDANDTGIRWIQMRGFSDSLSTSLPGPGASKPNIRIVDDSQGAMLETKSTNEPGGLGIDAINDGYAMSWESRGGGSSAAGFFGKRVQLGPEIDDEVKVQFDFRIWRDAPNLNGSNPNNVPSYGELRFGLYQDTDNQIGQTNPFAGRQVDEEGLPLPDLNNDFKPAVWGEEEGMFEGSLTGTQGAGDDVGTNGDAGWQASVFMGSPLQDNGGLSRLREEVQVDRILQGQDVDTIAQPQNQNPGDPFNPVYDFVNLDLEKVYKLELSLKRASESTEGDTILTTLTVTEKANPSMTWSLSGQDDLNPLDKNPGINSDAWDYFAIRNASSGAAEFDFLLDNFQVEVLGSNEPTVLAGDFNGDNVVDAADYTVWRDNLGASDDAINGAGDGVDPVNESDYAVWTSNYGASQSLVSSGAANAPEPMSIALLGLLTTCSCWMTRRRP